VKDDLNTQFGKVIRNFREEVGMSQQELGDYADLDRSYISDLERGRYTPTLLTLFKLAQVLKTKPSELIKLLEKKSKIS